VIVAVPWYVVAQRLAGALACVFLLGVFGNVEQLVLRADSRR
jgi:hypothetical protein